MSQLLSELSPAEWISEKTRAVDVDEIVGFLASHGTFTFPTLKTGLFSAAASDDPEFDLTGYQNVWIRDNIHVAHAFWVIGEVSEACQCVQSIINYQSNYRDRFVQIIDGNVSPKEIQKRPHIRFNGNDLTENEEHWSHAQNDALGYLLWLTCKLLRTGDLPVRDETRDVLSLLVRYFEKIEYWQDEDSGHWEETRKVEASSLGPVVAGLKQLQGWLDETDGDLPDVEYMQIVELIEKGEQALSEILPAECIQPDPSQNRRYDAALLFLIYPLEVIGGQLAEEIANDVREHLQGPIGIKRYIGDSYWCADYRTLTPAETRTTDYSEDLSGRDSLLKPGQEAQWCIFDPILSVFYGKRYLRSRSAEDRQLQIEYLRRSLAQLTDAQSRFPPYRCPESYFLENGEWIPNDICPLLWTQANLRLALFWFKEVLRAEFAEN